MTLHGFSTEQKLIDYLTSDIEDPRDTPSSGGVVFTSDFSNANKLPTDIEYKLR